MTHLLTIDNACLRIGSLAQLKLFVTKWSPGYDNGKIQPIAEVKRVIPYYYSLNDGNTGSSLWLFSDNCKAHAEGNPVIELPVHQPQGILL